MEPAAPGPFQRHHPPEDRDKSLGDKLAQEWPGILAWAVRGCLDWQASGLQEPEGVLHATTNYREQMDVLGDFLRERCYVGAEAKTLTKDLHLAFQEWAKDAGEKNITKQDFGQRLAERGFTPGQGAKAVRLWLGVGLNSANGLSAEIPVQGELDDGGKGGAGGGGSGIDTSSNIPCTRNRETAQPTPPPPPDIPGSVPEQEYPWDNINYDIGI